MKKQRFVVIRVKTYEAIIEANDPFEAWEMAQDLTKNEWTKKDDSVQEAVIQLPENPS